VHLPLDQGNSWNRLAVITKDCQPDLVLVNNDTEKYLEMLCAPELRAINVSNLAPAIFSAKPIAATSSSVATILYTSRSSGMPKGIVLKHEGFRNWLESSAQVYDLGSEVVLQQSSSGFDMSLIRILTALCLGGSIYLVPRKLRGDAYAISELIHSQRITYTLNCTSELFTWFKYGNPELLSQSLWRRAITGGEPGIDVLFEEFASLGKPELRLFHAYGPTEISWTATTMELFYSTFKDMVSYQNIATGHPLPNYSVYVLDKPLNAVPPGIQGEIYIGGPGVAAGYLNNGDVTAERFVPNELATSQDRLHGWNTLHRTGDVGRWREDGSLFIEGRISGDTQIKLRGLRIDLREVERALVEASNRALSEAVVTVHRSSPDSPQVLVAHVVFDQSHPHDERAQVLNTLQSRLGLPRYMCPSVIIPLDQMPLTTTLKLNCRAIAAYPLPENLNTQHVEMTEFELQLKSIWEDVIPNRVAGLHSIQPSTDFFHVGVRRYYCLTYGGVSKGSSTSNSR
jgi:hybrid polyketide synthase/nonribosomal peptide synthetase ACE1